MSYKTTDCNRYTELSGKGNRRCFIVGSEGKTALNNMGTSEVYECYGLKNQRVVFKRSYYCLWKDDTNISLGLNYYMEQGKKRTKISKAKYTAYLKSLQKLSGKINSKSNRKKYL